MIDWKNVFDQPIKIYIKAYKKIWKITTGQGDDYTTGFLLDYNYFIKHHQIWSVNTQFSRLRKSFANNSSSNIKLSKTA